MKFIKARWAAVAALAAISTIVPAKAEPLKNIVLVHGAWVDASGWKSVYEHLIRKGFKVTMVQEPETSFADDVTATKRILDLQTGPRFSSVIAMAARSSPRPASTRMSSVWCMLPPTLQMSARTKARSERRRRAFWPRPKARLR